MQKWVSESDPHKVRRLGKSLEELGELVAVLARCLIQGADEVDPSSGVRNVLRMQNEIADVTTQLRLTAHAYALDQPAMMCRINEKMIQMEMWEDHFRVKAY